MLGKQAIIEFFVKNNIDCIFHLPGLHTLPLEEELNRQHTVRVITGRHESDLTYMADGYAHTSGKPGIILVTAGPGLGNVVSGCMEAFNNDVPLLILHVDVEQKDIPRGVLHGIGEPETIFKNITKKIFIIHDISVLMPQLDNAYHESISGRKGPVLISIPYTFFEKTVPQTASVQGIDCNNTSVRECSGETAEPNHFFQSLTDLLRVKKKPIIIGGKALMLQECATILDDICRTRSIPFLTTTGGKGIIREDRPYAFGNVMKKGIVRDIITSSDLVIAIGTRLREVDAMRRSVKITELVHMDIDDRWMDKNYHSQLKFTGNLSDALHRIRDALKHMTFEWNLPELDQLRNEEESRLLKASPSYALIKLIRDVIPEDTTIVCDLNIPSYWAEYYFPVFCQNSFLLPRGVSPIFYSLPASIGAKLGKPDKPCLAICGDGGVLPTIGELAVIQQYSIPVIIFIHNNSSFAILEDIMADRYGIHNSMKLFNPDFTKIARAFGIKAMQTDTLEGLEKIFRHYINWNKPFLIEFRHPTSPPPWKY